MRGRASGAFGTDPFWTSVFALGDDFDELHDILGLSRVLYDEVMAWHARSLAADADPDASFRDEQDLLRRLADEVGPDIAVPAPRAERPEAVFLARGDVDRLPPSPELRDAVTTWRAQGAGLEHATGDNDAAIFAWEDSGVALARDVAEQLGPSYVVQPH